MKKIMVARWCAALATALVAVGAGSAVHASPPSNGVGGGTAAMSVGDYCRFQAQYWGPEQPWPPPTVRYGSYDRTYPSAVILAQCYLNMVLDPNRHGRLAVDGHFGPLTRQAVITFQSDWCGDAPPVDGIVGPRTWAGLQSWATSGYYAC